MRSGTGQGVSKWSRSKDRYIGRLYSDFGKVPSDSGIFRSTRELREFAGEYMGLIGPYENRGERPKGRRRATPSGPNWTRSAAPFSFSRSPSFLLSYSNKERRSPTPGGSRTPLGAPPPRPAAPSPLLLYIRGQEGTYRDTTTDH